MTMNLPKPKDFRPKARLDKRQTDPDKPDANPFDTSPQTEAEALHEQKVRAALAGMADALRKGRRWVTLEQLCSMPDAVAVIEGELPEIDGVREGVFLCSFSGTLGGEKLERVLIGGDCMLVSASSPDEAWRIAQEGLDETRNFAQRYAFAQDLGIEPNAGVQIATELRPKH